MSDNPYFDAGFSYGNYFSDAFILLDDESIIKLIHRNFEWTVNGEHFVRYNLTAGEILQMAKINIRSVRYTIKPDMNGSTELINSECKEWSQYSKESSVTPRVDFPHLISELIK